MFPTRRTTFARHFDAATKSAVAICSCSLLCLVGAQAQSERELRATQLQEGEPIVLDGILDEPAWQRAEVTGQFVQVQPHEGLDATEETEVRVLFDRGHLYVGVHCFDSQPDGILTTSLVRDFQFVDNDTFGIVIDSLDDNRNGLLFITTPDGAKRDVQVTNDGDNRNPNWDAVWNVRTQRSEKGWTLEVVIPFKTLRFRRGASRDWGINFSRRIRRKNEVGYWNPIPRRYNLARVSLAGRLTGLGGIEAGRNLKVTPYGLFEQSRRLGANETDIQGGVDAKYSLTSTLTLDLTLNTDFSEVEVDEQRVNLTRFPLFFPEKRPFFLESADLFHFGIRPSEKVGGPGPEEYIAFFSRRIGLSPDREPLPILGGTRLTGRAGAYSLGLMQIHTREENAIPSAGYTALRLKRDLFRKSDLGAIFLNRQGDAGDYSRVAGADLNLEFMERLSVTSFWAKSSSPGSESGTHAGKVFASWNDNLVGARAVYVDIGDNYDDSMGFVPRKGIRKFRNSFDLKPRPNIRGIREINPHVGANYTADQDFNLETRQIHSGIWVYFDDGSSSELFLNNRFERLGEPFEISSGVTLPVGDYRFDDWGFVFNYDPSRVVSGRFRYNTGEFWSGTRRVFNYAATFRARPHFSLEIGHQQNRVDLPEGKFVTDLATLRVHYGISTRQFVDALAQYTSGGDISSLQVRYNLIHRPLSDLFIVFHEQRASAEENKFRSFTVKFTRLFDF